MEENLYARGASDDSVTSQWVLGYYVGYQIDRCPIESIPWSCLTHIAFGPLKVKTSTDATGKSVVTLVTDFDDKPGEGVSDALKVSGAAHAHGVKALLMFGGAGESKSIGEAASDPHRKTLIGELLKLMEKLGYDGIDLDWEDDKVVDPTTGKIVVTPVVKSDLVALAKGLRDAKSDIILTFPAPAVNPNDPAHTEQLNFKKVAPHVDKFSVMTYTGTYGLGLGWASWFVSPLTGDDKAHFPVTIDQNLKLWTEDSVTKDGTTVTTVKGVPKDKLLMGIGAFAICYPRKGRDDDITEPRQMTLGRDQPGHEDDKITGGDNDFPLGDVFARNGTLDKNPAARHVDTITQQSYLSLPASVTDGHCGQASRYIPYDDEDSIVAKGKWSQTNGYGGTIVWTLQQLLLPSPATGATPTKPDGMSPDTLFQALKKGFLT